MELTGLVLSPTKGRQRHNNMSCGGHKKKRNISVSLWCPEPEASDRSGANGTCAVADRRGGNGITTRTVTGTKKEDRLGLLLFGARSRRPATVVELTGLVREDLIVPS